MAPNVAPPVCVTSSINLIKSKRFIIWNGESTKYITSSILILVHVLLLSIYYLVLFFARNLFSIIDTYISI